MKVDIWMPLYIGDLLKDTTRLKDRGFGIYMLLLIDLWTNDELPTDIEDLSFIARTDDVNLLSKIMDKYFTKTKTGYTQKRVLEEKHKSISRRESAKENGKKGGRPPKNNNPEKTNGFNEGLQNHNLNHNPQKSSSSSSSSSSSKTHTQSKSEGEYAHTESNRDFVKEYETIRKFWNEKTMQDVRKDLHEFGEDTKPILSTMRKYNQEEIKNAISNYSQHKDSKEISYGLPGFIKTGVEKYCKIKTNNKPKKRSVILEDFRNERNDI